MKINDTVEIHDNVGGTFSDGTRGEVIGFSTNLFGSRLVEVKLADGGKTVFYPHELTKI